MGFMLDGSDKFFLGSAMFVVIFLIFSVWYLDEKVQDKENIIIHEANAQFDARDAYIASEIEANKYEVVVGDKIYHAYFNDGNNQVRFLEKEVLE